MVLVRHELRRRQPLIEVRFFASAPFSGATVVAVCVFASLGGFLFLNTLYLQTVRGLSPFDAGLYTLPMAGVTLIVAPLSGRLVGNRGARVPLVVGSLGLLIGAAILTQLTATTPFWLLIITYFIFGLGFGVINPPITNTAVSGMPPSQAGVASAVASTARQVGSTLGVAVLGALAGASAAAGLGHGFAEATHVSWWIIVALSLIVLVVGVVTTTPWAMETARPHRRALPRGRTGDSAGGGRGSRAGAARARHPLSPVSGRRDRYRPRFPPSAARLAASVCGPA